MRKLRLCIAVVLQNLGVLIKFAFVVGCLLGMAAVLFIAWVPKLEHKEVTGLCLLFLSAGLSVRAVRRQLVKVMGSIGRVLHPLGVLIKSAFVVGCLLTIAALLFVSWFPELEHKENMGPWLLFLWAAALAVRMTARKLKFMQADSADALRKTATLAAALVALYPCSMILEFARNKLAPSEEELPIKVSDCRRVRHLDARPALDYLKTYS